MGRIGTPATGIHLNGKVDGTTFDLTPLATEIPSPATRDPKIMSNQIKLSSGRVIHLSGLLQTHTYGDWLLGFPTRETNNEHIRSLDWDTFATNHEP